MKKILLIGFSIILMTSCKKEGNQKPAVTQSDQGTLSDFHVCTTNLYHSSKSPSAPSAVGPKGGFWTNNTNGPTVLRVKFMDNNASEYVRSKIKSYAKVWEQYCNVRFDFVASNQAAEIRVSCQSGGGSWSYMGKDNMSIPSNQPTMNYGWLTDSTTEDEFSRVIVHEFGHALGLGHEQSHPQITIQWNKPYVYNYYYRTNGWSQAAVDANVFYTYPASQVTYSQYDPTSIMHYPVPKEFTLNGVSVGFNTQLSAVDKAFIQKMYPGKDTTTPVGETTLYTIQGFYGYIYSTLVTNTLTIKSDANKNIILYEAIPLYPLDYWKTDQYKIVDESGAQYTFAAQTSFEAKTNTGLKGAIKVYKNGQEVYSSFSSKVTEQVIQPKSELAKNIQ